MKFILFILASEIITIQNRKLANKAKEIIKSMVLYDHVKEELKNQLNKEKHLKI